MTYQRNLILNEPAVDFIRQVMRQKVDGRDRLDKIAGTDTNSKSPEEVLAACQRQVVKEICIEGVTSLSEVHLVAVGPVVVNLKLEVRPFTEYASPVPQQISAGHFGGLVYIGDIGR